MELQCLMAVAFGYVIIFMVDIVVANLTMMMTTQGSAANVKVIAIPMMNAVQDCYAQRGHLQMCLQRRFQDARGKKTE